MFFLLPFVALLGTTTALPHNSCAAADALMSVMHANSVVSPFCSSLLHLTPTTKTTTVLKTPALVTAAATLVTTAHFKATQTITSQHSVTATSDVTDVLSTTSTSTETDFFTNTWTSTLVDLEHNTATSDVYITFTSTLSETFTNFLTVTSTASTTVTAAAVVSIPEKRAASTIQFVPTPLAFESFAATLLSQACSCLSLPASTVTSTVLSTLAAPTTTHTKIVTTLVTSTTLTTTSLDDDFTVIDTITTVFTFSAITTLDVTATSDATTTTTTTTTDATATNTIYATTTATSSTTFSTTGTVTATSTVTIASTPIPTNFQLQISGGDYDGYYFHAPGPDDGNGGPYFDIFLDQDDASTFTIDSGTGLLKSWISDIYMIQTFSTVEAATMDSVFGDEDGLMGLDCAPDSSGQFTCSNANGWNTIYICSDYAQLQLKIATSTYSGDDSCSSPVAATVLVISADSI